MNTALPATAEDRIRIERAHVHAWPALQTENLDGWLWRASGGGSQRANSVSTVDFHGPDLHAAIARAEALYAARGMAARFQIYDETQPADLPDILQHRGYRITGPTITMLRRPARPPALDDTVKISADPSPEWLDVYLGAVTSDRREMNQRILQSAPSPSAFFTRYDDGRAVSTALCVVSHGCAVIECVATAEAARRSGSARAILHALLTWTAARPDLDLTALQVAADNTAAIRLYEELGFVPAAANRFWLRDPP